MALASACLRASTQFRLVAPNRFAAPSSSLSPGWRRGHLVTPDAAALIRSLTRPRRLPIDAADRQAVARLILDGLVAIEDRGRFRSGPDAHRLFFGDEHAPRPRGLIGRLSIDALTCAASLLPQPPSHLIDRLYRYNSRPISPAWRRKFPDAAALSRGLDLDGGLARTRSRGIASHVDGTWQAWDAPGALTPLPSAPSYKLYISPEPAETGTACRALRGLLGPRHGPFSMKAGRELASLLRPDRLVAYFASHEDLLETAERLRRRLGGLAAQGVPFTAALGADGLCSWGADMPVTSPLGAATGERSWRAWLTSRLGYALSNSTESTIVSPVRFALDRVSLDGVNTATWTPTASLLRLATTLSATTNADS
jgi:hypothetical protein